MNVAQGIRKVVNSLASQKPPIQAYGFTTTTGLINENAGLSIAMATQQQQRLEASSSEMDVSSNPAVPHSPDPVLHSPILDTTVKYRNGPSKADNRAIHNERNPKLFLLYSLISLVIGGVGFAVTFKNLPIFTQPDRSASSIDVKSVPSPSTKPTSDPSPVTSSPSTQPNPSEGASDSASAPSKPTEPPENLYLCPLLLKTKTPDSKCVVRIVYSSAQKTRANKISQVLTQKGYTYDFRDTDFSESMKELPQPGEIRILYKQHSQQQFEDIKTSLEALGLSVTQARPRENFSGGDIQIQLF